MRKLFWLFGVVIILTTILAVSVEAATIPEVDAVTLYSSSAFIAVHAELETETGEVSVKLEIPNNVDSETIIVVDDGATIRQYAVEIEESEREGLMLRMLNENKEEEVLITTESFSIEGTVEMTIAKQYVLLSNASFVSGISAQVPGKKVFLPIWIIESISATEIIEGLEEEQEYVKYLVVDETASQKEHTLTVSYFVTGAGWKPVYNLFLDTKANATMQYLTKASNNTNYNWENIDLTIVAGQPNMKYSYWPSYRYAYKDYAMEGVAGAPAPYEEEQYTSSELAEYHQYDLGRKVTIKKNSIAFIPLLSESLRYEKIYAWFAWQTNVQYKIKLKNTTSEPFADGWVSVYEQGKYIGGDSMDWVAKNDEVELGIGDALDIKAEAKEDSTTVKTPEYTRTHYKTTLHLENYKSTDVIVKVEDYIPDDAENIVYSVQPDKIEENEAEWNLPVSAGTQRDIIYEYDRTLYNDYS